MNPIRNSCAGLITAAALATTLSSAGLAAGTYDINVVLPLTGSAAFVGQGERDSLLALADQINATGGIAGDKLNFIFQDDPETAAWRARQWSSRGLTVGAVELNR